MGETSETHKRSRPWIRAAVIALLVLAVLIGWRWLIYHMGQSEYESRLAAYRAAGDVAELEDVIAAHDAAAQPNAAPLFLDAFAMYSSDPVTSDIFEGKLALMDMLAAGTPIDRSGLAEQHSHLRQRYGAVLEKLKEAVAIGVCRYPISAGVTPTDRVDIEAICGVVELLLALAVTCDGPTGEQQAEYIRLMQGVEDSLASSPLLMTQLVRLGLAAIKIETIGYCLATVPFSDAQLAAIAAGLQSMDDLSAFRRALRAERATMAGLYELPLNSLIGTAKNAREEYIFRYSGQLNRDRLAMLDYMDAVVASIEDDHWHPSELPTLPPHARVARTMLPPLGAALETTTAVIALHRAARTAIAAKRFQLKTGAWPDSPEELVPAYLEKVLEDPFDRQPLRHARTFRSVRFYSIGKDRHDNGGKHGDETDDVSGRDVVFPIWLDAQ